ncbi:sulfite oxidase heme-binding subunit YedZ [Aliikangiella maris]|uniref:Protein-methionine-sulfoxide reductase heme-binding subunit MsrQ n=2 Tax=Aliikangiella maris TaxID=3162458 RepID=A0ABV3MRK1_9GAMM
MIKTVRIFAHVAAMLPLTWLIFGIFTNQLGADPQEKLLHELGYWGMVFLLLSLSMTPARYVIPNIPWVKFRRMLGLYAAFHSLLHLLSYFIFILDFNLSEFINETVERPYIWFGMLAFIGLIPLVLTSTKAAQRRLKQRWKKLHQLVYFIIILVLIHFIWQSKSDLNEPLIYIIWAILLFIMRRIYDKSFLNFSFNFWRRRAE